MFKKYMNVEMVIEPGTHCAWVNSENGKLYAIDADQNLLFSIFPILFWIFPVKIYEVDYGEGGPSRTKVSGYVGGAYALGTIGYYLAEKFNIVNFKISPVLSIILAIVGGILLHLILDKKKANFVIKKIFWCRFYPIDIRVVINLKAYCVLLVLDIAGLWVLTFNPSNIVYFLVCIFVVWLSFLGENAFIKGKMKLRIISEITK